MTQKIAVLAQQNKIASTLFAFSGLALWVIFSSYANGPAKNAQLVTGAPFNSGQTCAKSGCHGGGAFGGTITAQLVDSTTNLPVTAYIPGKAYKFQISLKKTTGKPKYGYQTTAATATGTNVNMWGKAPTGSHSILKSKHNYVEQSKALASGLISIPWKGAPAGTGSVIFYTAGNLVNGDGGTSGDQVVNNSLTITQAPAPVAASVFSQEISSAKPVVPNKDNYSLKLYNQHGSMYVMFHNGSRQQKVQLTYTDLQGNPLTSGITVANEGDNIWPLKSDKVKGFVIVNAVTEDGVRTSLKVVIN